MQECAKAQNKSLCTSGSRKKKFIIMIVQKQILYKHTISIVISIFCIIFYMMYLKNNNYIVFWFSTFCISSTAEE